MLASGVLLAFFAIDGWLMWKVFSSPLIYQRMLAQKAEIEQLVASFEEANPSLWIFGDGQGF